MKYSLLVGGELCNKGAQSMTYISVNEIKSRFPDRKIVLFSDRDFKCDNQSKLEYAFDILPSIDLKTAFYFLGGLYKIIAKSKGIDINKVNKLKAILGNSDMMIDISGYQLGSNWGVLRMLTYIFRIKVAKKYNLKVYLMPQSFGPFNFSGFKGLWIKMMIKSSLKYPKIIYAREKEGFDSLKEQFNLNNVVLSKDLVLLNKSINMNHIFKKIPKICVFEMKGRDNVAIIPNMKNFKYGNQEKIIMLYEKIIERLLSYGKNIYLLRHAVEDVEACNILKDKFQQNNKVILLTNEFSCIEFDALVSKFNYIIASRYHSIVHAYKNSVPCIAIGWATKYHELLSSFKQEQYIFDVRQNYDLELVRMALYKMNINYKAESTVIKTILTETQNNNVFDVLEGSQ